MPVVDGSQIKDLVPVADGIYDAKFVKYEYKKSRSENDMDVCEFELSSDDEEIDGRKQFLNLTLTEKSLWKFKQTALALGADPEIFTGEFDTEDVLEELLGNPCRLDIGHQTSGDFAGRNNVKSVLAPGFDIDGDDESI
jgi:hypothetical protein